MNIFYRVFYRIGYRNLHRIPKNKAVILAPNHTNAFIDPTVLGMLLPLKVRFFARGDIFKGRISRYFLERLNISPMYRMQEGYSEVKKNDKAFEECKNLLSEDKCILLFPEGICVQERRLRKLKKGLARILFMTEEEFDFKKDVLVIPVGINYNDANKIRSKVFIDVGVPVSAKEYEDRYKKDKARTINEFTTAIENKMRETLVVIENPGNDELMKAMEEIILPGRMKEKGYDMDDMEKDHVLSVELGELLNKWERNDPQEFERFKLKALSYIHELHAYRLRDHLLQPDAIEKLSAGGFIVDFLIIWFGMPIYAFGLLANYPPYMLGKRVADKKVKHIEFHASVNVNLSWIFWFLWFGIQLLAVVLIFQNHLLTGIYALLVPLTLFYCMNYDGVMRKIFGRWRLMRLVKKNRNAVEGLMYKRQEIIEEFQVQE